ncbi:hypothetical protein CALVIDRAFT_537769 [Calocera viscosa TUFC12733]|uniref:Uncharacterized protein n=1 Tax=Calocera viscosa (strain TUFC12733) TaxID=1330018 RepID=A0A167LKR5_CALVF|nr:hypothetical protein CALVIDRAFT_537769 [Calocera viscosa TUFC12733]
MDITMIVAASSVRWSWQHTSGATLRAAWCALLHLVHPPRSHPDQCGAHRARGAQYLSRTTAGDCGTGKTVHYARGHG